MVPLEKLQAFMRLLHKVQNVKRVARVPDEREYRNTAEHTFELALLCWYIAGVNDLKLDHEKMLKYALAHDLIEAYAGDTYIYDTESQKTKREREEKALKQIESEFREFPELINIIHKYEDRADAESAFVYATDKLIDPLNISMETSESFFKAHNIPYADLRKYKDHKISSSAPIESYWQQLVAILEARKDFFFHH